MKCKVKICDREIAYGKSGLCSAHLSRLLNTGDIKENVPIRNYGDKKFTGKKVKCRAPGCDRGQEHSIYCSPHYARLRRT